MEFKNQFEYYFWLSVVILTFIASIVLSLLLWAWNKNNSTIFVIETNSYSSAEIPFPAITICNPNVISRKRAFEFAETLRRPNNLSVEELAKTFPAILNENFGRTANFTPSEIIQQVLTENNISLDHLAASIKVNCKDMFVKCTWQGVEERCNFLFHKIATFNSFCCTTNFFARKGDHFGMKLMNRISLSPVRSSGAGYAFGFSFYLDAKVNDYFASDFITSKGIFVMIHDAFEFPVWDNALTLVESETETFLNVLPTTAYATDDVKNLPIKVRKCLFPYERNLKFIRNYTLNNCLLDCRIKATSAACDCLPAIFADNVNGSNCSLQQHYCLLNADNNASEITRNLVCNCLPVCEFNSYSVQRSAGRLYRTQIYGGNEDHPTTFYDVILHVFYGTLIATRFRRDVSEDWFSTLASYGGILGLMMGFSIMCVFEFIYIFLCRPIA